MNRWTYETYVGSDIWRGDICESKEEAIKLARKEATEEGRKTFKIGIVEDVDNFGIDVDSVIENIQETMYDEMGEVAEDYLDDVTTEQLSELEEQLNDVFYAWQERYNHKPTFYRVVNEEILDVE